MVTSLSVTSTVPLIGVLTKPIFAVSENDNVEPDQLRCSLTSRMGTVADAAKEIVEGAIDRLFDFFFRLIV